MADQKLSDLTPDAAPTIDDLIYAVNDPSGVPADRQVTLGNAMLLAPHYVDRGDAPVGDNDFDIGDFTTDGAWYDLDLSAIAPAGAVMTYLRITLMDDAVGTYIRFRKNGYANTYNVAIVRTQVANASIDANFFVSCDSNRVIEYSTTNTTIGTLNVNVMGWIIDTIN